MISFEPLARYNGNVKDLVSLLYAFPHLSMVCKLNLYADQLRVRHHHSCHPHVVCSYCQSFDYKVNSYPYYDVSHESYTRSNVIIETMNEQHKYFVSETRECGLL